MYGSNVKVIEPITLQDKIKGIYKDAQSQYDLDA